MPIDTVTEIDSAWLDLNSIQVCFEKVFTLAQTRLDRSQFAFGIFWAFRHVQIAFDLHRTDLFIFRFVFLLCQRSTATFIVYSRSIVLIRFWKRGFVFVWIAIIQFNHGLAHPSFRSNCLYFKHYRKASKVSKNTSCARDGGRGVNIIRLEDSKDDYIYNIYGWMLLVWFVRNQETDDGNGNTRCSNI